MLGPCMTFCEYPTRKVTFASGSKVRLVSVIRRTVLNRNGELVSCGQASAPEGETAIDCPLGMFGLPSRS